MHAMHKPLRTHGLMAVVVLATLLPVTDSLAATYYVDQGHSNARDTNPGTSESTPWGTLQRAMQADVVAGDTVYVKNGTYTDMLNTSTAVPSFNPSNSGSSGAPIAYRAYTPPAGTRHRPIVSRTLSGVPGENSPVIGTFFRNHIIWDGFTLAAGTDVRIEDCTGCILENLLIDKGATVYPGSGNYNGIFIENSDNVVIRQSIIRNVYYTNANHHNAAGIVLFSNSNVRIHNNRIGNSNTAIFDKEGGVGNLYELNYIHDIYEAAIVFSGQVQPGRCGTCPVQFNQVRQNIFVNAVVVGDLLLDNPAINSNIDIYNNTMYNVGRGLGTFGALPALRYYNNIIHLTGTGQDYSWPNGVPADLLSDFSNFQATSDPQARFRVSGVTEGLSQWQGRGFDLNSSTLDPLFVGPLSPTVPTALRLQSGSPLRGAGRLGGLLSGSPVNMGAYISDSDIIGPENDFVAPNTATNLQVQ